VTLNKIYDTTTIAAVNDAWTSNIINNEVTLSISADYNTKNITANSIDVTFTLSGNIYENYIIPENYTITENVSISKKVLTISSVIGVNRQYNGTNIVDLTGGTLEGILGTESVTFVLNQATVSSANASATYYNVLTNIALDGADNANYSLMQPEHVTAMISPKECDVIWSNNTSFIYNGKNQSGSVTAKYKDINAVDILLSVNFGNEFKNVGNYTATAIMSNINTNYTLTNAILNLTIAPLQIIVSNLNVTTNKTYDTVTNAAISAWISNIVDDAVLTVSANYNTQNITANSILVTFKLTGDTYGNYILPENYIIDEGVSISPLQIVVSNLTVETEKMYDGTTNAEISDWTSNILMEEVTLTINAYPAARPSRRRRCAPPPPPPRPPPARPRRAGRRPDRAAARSRGTVLPETEQIREYRDALPGASPF
jgi:hypothetical protein